MQLYSYCGGNDARNHLEIDAHVGGVNDLAFSEPYEQLLVVSCGDDKIVKVWDAVTGAKQYSFEGHGASVYSICPHYKENINSIFSTSVDGMIKTWSYDHLGPRVNYEAPGHCCTAMAYSDDGFFSCGTHKDGQSYIVEWNESEGHVERTYQGLQKNSSCVLQFDITKNQYLAVGDEHLIKIWHMDSIKLLTTTDADGDLPACPLVRFNKEGTLLAVPTSDNRIKILANDDGLQLLQMSGHHSSDVSIVLTESLMKNVDAGNLKDMKPTITEGPDDKVQKQIEISDPSHFRSLRLTAHVKVNKILRLIYINAGIAILALASNAIHLLWRWPHNDINSNGQATTKVAPQFWQPKSGKLMNNDIVGINPEESVPCCALSKNDSYLISASGGKISLFNMLTFTTMTTLMPQPPAVTSIAFNPRDNNEIAFGRDDATIMIYNVRKDEVKSKLEGHFKRVTGLAFSNSLNTLVSSGGDAQIILWNSDKWTKQKSMFVQIPVGKTIAESSDLYIQFHHDQTQILVVHETHLAIYETIKLECVKQWVPGESSAPISHGTLSCDGLLAYASFRDGAVSIFRASDFQLKCRINPAAYLSPVKGSIMYPVVIAAHPKNPNQIALGMTNGEVYVFEPLGSEGKWDELPPVVDQSVRNSIPMAASPSAASESNSSTID